MIFGFGKGKKETSPHSNRRINKDIEGIMRELKKNRAKECQNLGMSVSKMGQDLAYLDKKVKQYYNEAIKQLKTGKSHGEAYEYIMDNLANSDIDRKIVDKIFSGK